MVGGRWWRWWKKAREVGAEEGAGWRSACSGGGGGLSTHVGARTVEPLSTLGFVNVVARTSTLQM